MADVIKLVVKGQEYDFEMRMPVGDARIIKRLTKGMGVSEWLQGWRRGDPDALMALVYLAKMRAGEQVRWADLDDIDILEDIQVRDDEDADAEDDDGDPALEDDDQDDEDEEAPDPTPPGPTRKSGSAPTSSPSRSASNSTRGTRTG